MQTKTEIKSKKKYKGKYIFHNPSSCRFLTTCGTGGIVTTTRLGIVTRIFTALACGFHTRYSDLRLALTSLYAAAEDGTRSRDWIIIVAVLDGVFHGRFHVMCLSMAAVLWIPAPGPKAISHDPCQLFRNFFCKLTYYSEGIVAGLRKDCPWTCLDWHYWITLTRSTVKSASASMSIPLGITYSKRTDTDTTPCVTR